MHTCIYGHALPPPRSPPKVYGPDIGWGPPSLWCGVWGLSSPCGVVVRFWGLGFSLLLSFGFTVKRCKASSRQELREDLQCMFCFGLRACI